MSLTRIIRSLPFFFPLYVIRFSIGPFPTTLIECFLGLIILCSLLPSQRYLWKQGWDKTKPWHLPVGLWILATIFAVIIAPNHFAALGLWRAYLLEPILFGILLLGSIQNEQQKNQSILAFIGSAIWIAIFCCFQFAFNLGIPHPWNTDLLHRRATGPFPYPNAVALYCTPLAALCFAYFFASKKNTPIKNSASTPFLIGFLSATLATLLAKSVGGLLAIAATCFIALVKNQRTRLWTICISAIIGITILTLPVLRTPILRNLSFGDWSGKVRLVIWKETRTMLADHPIQGAGLGAYPAVIKPYHKATWMEIFQYPHNILLNLWSETGLLGILAFTWICFTWFRLSKLQAASYQLPLFLPLLAILIHGLVDVPYFKNDLALAFFTFMVFVTLPKEKST